VTAEGAAFRIGILGCAEVAKYALIDAVRYVPGLEVVAVAGRDSGRAQAYAKEQGIPRVYASYSDLIAADDIDLVYVALPNSHHGEWSIRALQQGKAVLCEKPLAANEREALAMANAAVTAGRPLIEAFHFRYHPLMRRVGALLGEGAIGRLRSAEVRWRIPGSMVGADNIRFRYDLAGGAAMDPGCYCVNLLRYIFGSEPDVIDAEAQCVTPDVDHTMQAQLRFPGGGMAQLFCSLSHPGEGVSDMDMWLAVEGEQGKLRVQNPFLPQIGHELTFETATGSSKERFDLTSTYVYQAQDVLAVMRGERVPLTPAVDGVGNMRVVDAIYRAAGLRPRGDM
jgi:predicted dehydrogenase